MGELDTNLTGHNVVHKLLTTTKGANPKRERPWTQLDMPQQSLGGHQPNSLGNTQAWEAVATTQKATSKSWTP